MQLKEPIPGPLRSDGTSHTRPLVGRYDGSGDVDLAASWPPFDTENGCLAPPHFRRDGTRNGGQR